MTLLPTPPAGRDDVVGWVRTHLGDLALEGPDGIVGSSRFRGGQAAADAALAAFDVAGYARARNEVAPVQRRGASGLSPWIRHGLLPLRRVWDSVTGAPARDRDKFRDELLWQEYSRHLYARLGRATARPLRHEPARGSGWRHDEPWPREMACMDLVVGELERDGWLVNQTRMWLAAQWSGRAGADWAAGEQEFFAHLLDGSRAANRAGWQWTVGALTGKAYGFSRWQVEKRAPGTCAGCALRRACPVQDWPEAEAGPSLEDADPRLRHDPDVEATAGPSQPTVTGEPAAVWLTAESLGHDDPALLAHPELPAVFVLDEPLLARLRLSGKRLVFLAECLADLAEHLSDNGSELQVHRGAPVEVLAGRPLAATYAPVPGWRDRARALDVVAVHPWPWLVRPHAGPIGSFTAWSRRAGRPR
ncbi:MAG: FAD-binding domain-containing protein [Motilibacteraceae bacterium]